MTNAGTPAVHSPPWRWQAGAGPETGRPSMTSCPSELFESKLGFSGASARNEWTQKGDERD